MKKVSVGPKDRGRPPTVRRGGRPSASISVNAKPVEERDVFTKRRIKMCEIVALEVVRDIVAERLKPGDRLIDEAKMLARYRTSRATLREALRLLEVQGLIAIRAGRGASTVVGQVHSANLGRTMTLYLHMMGANYDQLLDAWQRADALLARLAAENPDRELVNRRLSPFLKGASPDSHGVSIDQGLDFHQVVAELADNPVLSLALAAISGMHTPHLLNITQITELEPKLVHEHALLAEAIIAGEADRAEKLMTEHVGYVIETFRSIWPRLVGERIEWR
jgi:GntR family transcriptional repressor for pyruvate dehydrogenase complex